MVKYWVCFVDRSSSICWHVREGKNFSNQWEEEKQRRLRKSGQWDRMKPVEPRKVLVPEARWSISKLDESCQMLQIGQERWELPGLWLSQCVGNWWPSSFSGIVGSPSLLRVYWIWIEEYLKTIWTILVTFCWKENQRNWP